MYDIIVIGSGTSSLFFLHELKDTSLKILVLEKGNELKKRYCPKKETVECRCGVCSRHYGLGGPLKHEGKFNYTNDFGGDLGTKIGEELSLELQYKVDDILMKYTPEVVEKYSTHNEKLQKRASNSNLELLTTEVRHLGVNNTYEILCNIYNTLKDKIEFKFNVETINIEKQNDYFLVNNIKTKKVVVATNNFDPKTMCPSLNIKQDKVRLDIGLRIEMLKVQWDEILSETIETKLKSDNCFTYCMNPSGRVVEKVQKGYIFADGQNFNEINNISDNLNFTLFQPQYFNSEEDLKQYLSEIMSKLDNKVAVQRLIDLRNKQVTTDINRRIIPTYNCNQMDLNNVLSTSYLAEFYNFLEKLELFLQKKILVDTLIYGIDTKFYAPMINTNSNFEAIDDLHLIGDCSGVTSSLSQAAASGLYVASKIIKI